MNARQVSDVIPASERPDRLDRIPEAGEFEKITVYGQKTGCKLYPALNGLKSKIIHKKKEKL
jgi:hypothetical protein